MECKIYKLNNSLYKNVITLFFNETDYSYNGIILDGNYKKFGYYSNGWGKAFQLYKGEIELVIDNDNIIFDKVDKSLFIKRFFLLNNVDNYYFRIKMIDGNIKCNELHYSNESIEEMKLKFKDEKDKKIILKNKI